MARREFNVFNLSFLDVISCGFGAVILFFMIINAQVKTRSQQASVDLLNETEFLQEEIFDEQKRMVKIKNEIEKTAQDNNIINGSIQALLDSIEKIVEEISLFKNQTLAANKSMNQLKSDVKQLEQANNRMTAESELAKKTPGDFLREFVGEGNRQYVTELKLGGKHVLFLVDASTSMLGRTYVNVIRYRNMRDEQKVKAPKWRQTVNSVDWLTTRLEAGTKFQIYFFNESAQSIISGTDGQWLEVTDGTEIKSAIDRLRGTVPAKGTSLINAFETLQQLNPRPDNIFLLTDGLPTQGNRSPLRETRVSPEQRIKYFNQALRELPPIPVNVLLFPMDGDPLAAEAFWRLAIRSKGSFMAPSRDWP